MIVDNQTRLLCASIVAGGIATDLPSDDSASVAEFALDIVDAIAARIGARAARAAVSDGASPLSPPPSAMDGPEPPPPGIPGMD